MSISFWKNCNEAFYASKVNDFDKSYSLCNAAILTLKDNKIDHGRKKYANALLQYISQKERALANPTINKTNDDQNADHVKKLQDENTELKKRLLERPFIDPLCITDPSHRLEDGNKSEFGIIVFGHTRLDSLASVLESLKLQDALKYTEVWLDGDQGNSGLKKKVDKTIELVKTYPVKHINTQRGHYGFRKMILLGLSAMIKKYRDILILEDDCFPVDGAIKEFRKELDNIRYKNNIFSVYGHHFGIEDLTSTFTRFQGWGWATTGEKLLPILRQLIDCYSMPENEYLQFVEHYFSEEIKSKIEITPPRLPSHTLKKFFAWDETLCLLSALNGLEHKPTKIRTIFNCGLGDDSTHFQTNQLYRNPPFNMISPNEVWNYFN